MNKSLFGSEEVTLRCYSCGTPLATKGVRHEIGFTSYSSSWPTVAQETSDTYGICGTCRQRQVRGEQLDYPFAPNMEGMSASSVDFRRPNE